MGWVSPGPVRRYAALLVLALVLVGTNSSPAVAASSKPPTDPGARGRDLISNLPGSLTCEDLHNWENVSLQSPPDRWKLAWWQRNDSRGMAGSPRTDDYFCTGVSPGDASSPMCNLLGGTLLMAVRFASRWPFWIQQTNNTNSTSGDGSQQYDRNAATTSKNIPWLLADRVMEANTSQKQLTTSKQLHGEAQVDMFLCSDEECTVQADLRTVLRVTKPLGGLHANVTYEIAFSLMYSRFANTGLGISAAFAADPNTTSCIYTGFHGALEYRAARSVWPMDRDTTVSVSTVFWVDETSVPLQLGAYEYMGPAFMPTGVLQRLWAPHDVGGGAPGDLIIEGVDNGNDDMGLETLRYGLYRARDLHSGSDLGCITLILPAPDKGWMDAHGWNESDPSCSGAANSSSVYAFVSYFNQAWWLDERVKPLGAVRLDSHNRTEYAGSRIDASDESIYGVAYESRFPLGNASMAPHLKLNASAFQAYGKRMGLRMGLSNGVGGNQPTALEFKPKTSVKLDWTSYRVISIGTATLLACKAPDRGEVGENYTNGTAFSVSLLRLKLNMTVQPEDALQPVRSDPKKDRRTNVWCWDTWPIMEKYLGSYLGLLHACDMEGCGDDSGNSSVRCSQLVGSCSFLDSLGIGFAHSPPGSHSAGDKVPRPPTLPASGLMGQVGRLDLVTSDGDFQQPMQGVGQLPSDYLVDRVGSSQVIRSSARALQQQMAIEMTNTDATRTLAGSLMDTTLLVAGIFALASGYKDLCILITRLLSRLVLLLVCGCPCRGIKVMACVFACVLAKFFTCFIIVATLVVGPGLTLVAENDARDSNPGGDQSTVRWVKVKLGPSPYHFVAAVAITIEAMYDDTAYRLVKMNLGLAAVAAFCLCCCVLKTQIMCVWRACDLPVMTHSPRPSLPSSCMGCVDAADGDMAVDVESAAGSLQQGRQRSKASRSSHSGKATA